MRHVTIHTHKNEGKYKCKTLSFTTNRSASYNSLNGFCKIIFTEVYKIKVGQLKSVVATAKLQL